MRWLYRILRIVNDVNAIKRGTYGRRVRNRMARKAIRRLMK
ncbi:MAG TPA: hypothetical protein VK029_00215 [Pseudogracilibacillus sp.]|nr:hypothetical protein [Pseudogracilibacillus sp.]